MRLTRTAFALMFASTLALGACSDDSDSTGVVIADFQGSWDASSIRYTSKVTTGRSLDITSVGGDLQMNIASTGAFTGTFKLPVNNTIQTIPVTGTVTITGDNTAHVDLVWPTPELNANPPVTDFDATFTLNGNLLSFTRDNTTFTYPGQTTAEASVLVIAMARTTA